MLRHAIKFFSKFGHWPCLAAVLAVALILAPARGDVVAHWSFDETDANGAYADSAKAHPATPGDRSQVFVYEESPPAPFGKAVAFNGSGGSFLTIPPITTIQKSSFTVAAWVNLRNAGKNYILTDWVSNAQSGFVFGLDPIGPDKTKAQTIVNMVSAEGSGRRRLSVNRLELATPSVPLNEWHHLAWTWDRDSQTVTAYKDGVSIGENKRPATGNNFSKTLDLVINNRPMRIGSREASDAGSQIPVNFNGAIDELWVFDQALTPVQLKNLVKFNDISGQSTPSPVVRNATPAPTPTQTPTPAPVIATTPVAPTPVAPTAVAPTPVAPTPDVATAVVPTPVAPTPVAPSPDTTTAATVENRSTPTIGFGVTPDSKPPMPISVASNSLGAGRVLGIVACLTIVVTMACYLIWAVTERGKLRAAGRM